MNLKRIFIFLFLTVFLFFAAIAGAKEEYNPPFQISGIVKSISEDSIEVYLPYIKKQVTVIVLPDTVIKNRMKSNGKILDLSAIAVEDLVVIKGILQGESFCSKNISFLPSSK